MIDDEKLDELLAFAEKATPGPWIIHEPLEIVTGQVKNYDHAGITWEEDARAMHVSIEADDYSGESDEDAENWAAWDRAYIAACDPETIRALVAEVKLHRYVCANSEPCRCREDNK